MVDKAMVFDGDTALTKSVGFTVSLDPFSRLGLQSPAIAAVPIDVVAMRFRKLRSLDRIVGKYQTADHESNHKQGHKVLGKIFKARIRVCSFIIPPSSFLFDNFKIRILGSCCISSIG